MKIKLYLMLTAALLAFSSLSAWADHPAYLRALSDLRQARAYIYDGPHGGRLDGAITQINAAINALKNASIDDGRDLDWAPPIDTGLGGGRLGRLAIALWKAPDSGLRKVGSRAISVSFP
jgi:hypothetical protein